MSIYHGFWYDTWALESYLDGQLRLLFFHRLKDAKAFAQGISLAADRTNHHFVYSIYKIHPESSYNHFEQQRARVIEKVARGMVEEGHNARGLVGL